MRITQFISTIVLLLGTSAFAETRLDRTKQFSYEPPDGWTVGAPIFGVHNQLIFEKEGQPKRSITIADQGAPDKSMEELKAAYERDFPRALKDFQFIRSEMISLVDGRPAVRFIHTNTTPGAPVRQVGYIVSVGPKRYFVTFTSTKEVGDKHDKEYEAFINSMKLPD